MVAVETDAADQELLVYLPHHWAGATSLTLCHGNRHSQRQPRTGAPINLAEKNRECENNPNIYKIQTNQWPIYQDNRE